MGRRGRDSLECPGAGVLRLLGLWRPREAESRLRLLRGASSCLTLVAIAFVAVSAALKLFVDRTQKLEALAHCSFVALFCSIVWIRAVLFIVEGSTLRQLMQLLIDVRAQHTQGEGNGCTRRRYQKHVKRVYLFLQVAVVSAVIEWLSSPLLSRAAPGGGQSSRQLPLPIWLPVDIHESPTFEILYAAQCFGLTVVGVSAACIDIFFIHAMQVIGAELEVLSDNFSAMHKNCQSDDGAKYRVGIYECHTSNKTPVMSLVDEDAGCVSDEQMHMQLANNIRHHRRLLRAIALLQMIMSVPIFILLFMNMANLCANLFIAAVLIQRDGNVSKALKALMVIPPVFYETGMYCIFGQILTDQSEKLTQSAFSCGWAECDPRFRRSLLIFMTETVRPVEIKVGKMTKLSKQLLLQVLNGTYGLLNMLYHFHSNM